MLWARTCILFLYFYASQGNALNAAEILPTPIKPEWSRFLILVWQYQTDAQRDKALYESLNLRGFHLDHHFPESAVQFAKENGWPFYVDHSAGKGYLYLTDKDKKSIAKARGTPVRPNSLADPETISKMKELLRDHISRAREAPVVAYAFDDEISLFSFTSPSDVDGHPHNIEGFRSWLQGQYDNIEHLNREWGSNFSSFLDVRPCGFDDVRKTSRDPIPTWNLAPWLDWRTYMDVHFAEVLADLTKYSNSLDPRTLAGFVGGQQPSPWGGYNYARLADSVQWMEAYDINGVNEILRSFWDQGRPRLQTFFSSKDPKLDAWFLWYYLAHGNRGVIAWPEGWFAEAKAAYHIRQCGDTFKQVQSDIFKLIIDSELQHDPIAIYYSHPSIQVSWAMDATVHGASWINRNSSLDDDNSVAGLNRLAWLKILEDLGYQPRFIRESDLLEGQLFNKGIRVLILNHTLSLSSKEAAAITSFAESGGTVLADEGTGLFNEHGKGRSPGILDNLFGIRQYPEKGFLGGDKVTEIDGEKYIEEDFSKRLTTQNAFRYNGLVIFGRHVKATDGTAEAETSGTAVLVRRKTAPGEGVFLNLSPIEYLLYRNEAIGERWRAVIGKILLSAGLRPRLHLSENGKSALEAESIFWKNGERIVLCVVKNPIRHSAIGKRATNSMLKADHVTLELQFASKIEDLVNERTRVKLGDGHYFSDDWKPWEANVYSFRLPIRENLD